MRWCKVFEFVEVCGVVEEFAESCWGRIYNDRCWFRSTFDDDVYALRKILSTFLDCFDGKVIVGYYFDIWDGNGKIDRILSVSKSCWINSRSIGMNDLEATRASLLASNDCSGNLSIKNSSEKSIDLGPPELWKLHSSFSTIQAGAHTNPKAPD